MNLAIEVGITCLLSAACGAVMTAGVLMKRIEFPYYPNSIWSIERVCSAADATMLTARSGTRTSERP